MDEEYEKIRERDEEVFSAFTDYAEKFIPDFLQSEYSYVCRSLLFLEMGSVFLKNSIYDCYESQSVYSAKILFRCLIEYFLRHSYIFTRFVDEKKDDVGVDFYNYCDMGENFDYYKALRSSQKIFDPSLIDDDSDWEKLKSFNTDFSSISPSDLKRKVEQFQHKKIIKYLNEVQTKNSINNDFLKKIIPLYSELSSYVHGGPQSHKFHLILKGNNDEINEEILDICKWAFNLNLAMKQFNLTIVAGLVLDKYNKEYLKMTKFKFF